jgi:hypothetical protein
VKKILNLTFIFVLAVFIFFLISPFIFKYQKFSKHTLQKEYDYIKNKIEVFHIGRLLENSFKLNEVKIPKMMNRYEFYQFLGENFYIAPEVHFNIPYQNKTTKLLPLKISYLDNVFKVINSGCEIPQNAVIIKINDEDLENVYLRYKNCINGNNDYVKKHNFTLKILPILPDFERKNKFKIEYQYEGFIYTKVIEAINFEEYTNKIELEPFEYIKINSEVGLLKINHFDVVGNDFFKMLTLLESISEEDIKTILIDMRNSYGNVNDLSGLYMLLSFFTGEIHYLSDNVFYSFGNKILKYENFGYIHPNEKNFSNKNLIFISDRYINHPLPMFVLSFVKKWKIGKIIGDISSYPANFYGSMKEFSTHWTNIKFFIPTTFYENYSKNYIAPDIFFSGDYVKYVVDNF